MVPAQGHHVGFENAHAARAKALDPAFIAQLLFENAAIYEMFVTKNTAS